MKKIITLLFLLCSLQLFSQAIYYVKTGGSDGNSGLSWGHAFRTLQKALATVNSGQVWVAEGTYYPDEIGSANSNNRTAAFSLKNHVAVYGGFAGTEMSPDQRNLRIYKSILSGDIDQWAGTAGNSYNVLRNTSLDTTALLDGFTITGGAATSDDFPYCSGGGMNNNYASPTIINCTFSGNESGYHRTSGFVPAERGGGAIFNIHSSPRLTRCTFASNLTVDNGGAIANLENSSPLISQCIFDGNECGPGIYGGGAVYNLSGSSPRITNCLFVSNYSNGGGGAITTGAQSSPTITNCTFWGNRAGLWGAAVYTTDSWATVSNCILWHNSEGWTNGYQQFYNQASDVRVTYSLVQGGYPGIGNKDTDPLFRVAGNNYHLLACSPAVNAGNAAVVHSNEDLDGQPRVAMGVPDMGAFEFQPKDAQVIYVNQRATGLNNGSSWEHAFIHLQDALAKGATCPGNIQVWVAAGTYYPDEGAGVTDNDRNASFVLKNNMAVYGGFAGYEFLLRLRSRAGNETILSGHINQQADSEDNSGNAYHVIRSANVDSTAILDGFTITRGNANDRFNSENLRGGGAYLQGSPRISYCIFRSNHANDFGGGLAANHSSFPQITNCVFQGNSASISGGGLSNFNYSGATMIHCTFAGNTAPRGGAIHNLNSTPYIFNSILWGNSAEQVDNQSSSAHISWSIVQDGYFSGEGNVKSDPMFIDVAGGNLHLQPCSPAIDAGNKVIGRDGQDLDGRPRIIIVQTDMGAYEFPGTIIYVKQDATGRANGTSWDNAFTKLQDALALPTGCSRLVLIWVAKGTYYPDEGIGLVNNNRNLSFRLKNGVALLGGFGGTETVITERHISNIGSNTTTLSGEIDGVAGTAGNAYHVVRSESVDYTAIMDGFTITGGAANGPNTPDNEGGGLYNTASPTISMNSFHGNTAINGAAMYNSGAATVLNCSFTQNKAVNGGGIYNASASPAILNGVFWKNQASNQGGAIYNMLATPIITNGSFYGNSASSGGGIYNNSSSPGITNCILWGNSVGQIFNSNSTPQVTYSIVQGSYSGEANLASDPLFQDAVMGNLNINGQLSPAWNTGKNAVATMATDFTGSQNRIIYDIVDRGAYEWSNALSLGWFSITCPGDFTLYTNAENCKTVADFTGSRAAKVIGGNAPVTITYDPAQGTLLPAGDVLVTVTATDSYLSHTTCSFWVTVVDTTAPVITGVTTTPLVLYPPNHKMREVQVNYNVSDNCPDVTTVLSVTSNEPEYGSGSGDTGPDWIIVDDHHLQLRAERSGNGTGRIYTITITAKDASGNTSTASTTVTVPHDKSSLTSARTAVEKEVPSLVVKAVPNPSTEGFTIYTQSPSILPLNIRMMDGAGHMIESRTGVVANGALYIGNNYRPGVYYLQVLQGDVLQTIKLVKQNR